MTLISYGFPERRYKEISQGVVRVLKNLSLDFGSFLAESIDKKDLWDFARELQEKVFGSDLQIPRIDVKSNVRGGYLGRALLQVLQDREGNLSHNMWIEIQKRAMQDEELAKKVLAHELIHIYQYQQMSIEEKARYVRGLKAFDPHGESFERFMNKINSIYGKDFVTKTGEYTEKAPSKEFNIAIIPSSTRPGKFAVGSFFKLTPKAKRLINRFRSDGLKIFRSNDDVLLQMALTSGMRIPSDSEIQQQLKKTYETGEEVLKDVSEAEVQEKEDEMIRDLGDVTLMFVKEGRGMDFESFLKEDKKQKELYEVLDLLEAMSTEEALKILDLTDDALGDQDKIKAAYRKTAMLAHPDRGGSEELMKMVNDAYEQLKTSRGGGKGGQDIWQEIARKHKELAIFVKNYLDKEVKKEDFLKYLQQWEPGLEMTSSLYPEDLETGGWGPSYAGMRLTFKTPDGKRALKASFEVDLASLRGQSSLGGDDVTIPLRVLTSVYVDGKNQKIKQVDWSHKADKSLIIDPSSVFPKPRMKKIFSGEVRKGSKFSKRDMIAALRNEFETKWSSDGSFVYVMAGEDKDGNALALGYMRNVLMRVAAWTYYGIYRKKGLGFQMVDQTARTFTMPETYETVENIHKMVDEVKKASDEDLAKIGRGFKEKYEWKTEESLNENAQDFSSFNWNEIAHHIGGKVLRKEPTEVEISLNDSKVGYGKIIISDNGGEVNISKVVPAIDFSVPYSNQDGLIHSLTLSTRLYSALRGEPIDYQWKWEESQEMDFGSFLKEQEDYFGAHRPPNPENGAPLHDLSKIYPEDIYSPQAVSYYGDGEPYDKKAISVFKIARGNPEQAVRIYRAVPKGVKEINAGDWVTITKEYAQEHGENWVEDSDTEFEIIEKIVKAKEVFTDGNSLHEQGYWPGGGGGVKESLDFDSFLSEQSSDTVRLYRGMEQEFDPNYDLSKTDAPSGYSTWTDSLELAKQYAGKDGFVYYMDLPKSEEGENAIDENPKSETYGDRVLFFFNDKKAGLNGVSGREALVYTDHELFDLYKIKLLDIKESLDFGSFLKESANYISDLKSSKDVNEFLQKLKSLDPNSQEDFLSKVRNINRELQKKTPNSVLLYHGSPKKFEKFQLTKGQRSGVFGDTNLVDNLGIFMTDSKRIADYFGANRADNNLAGHNLYEAWVDLGKVLDMETGLSPDLKRLALKLVNEYEGTKKRKLASGDYWWVLDRKEFVEALKQAGYDSVKFRESISVRKDAGSDGNTYFVMNPARITIISKEKNKLKTPEQIFDYIKKNQITEGLLSEKKIYKYCNPLRPPHDFMPKWDSYDPNGTVTGEKDRFCRHGVVAYASPLSDEQIKKYELIPFGDEERLMNIAEKIAAGKYTKKYLEMGEMGEDQLNRKIHEKYVLHPLEVEKVIVMVSEIIQQNEDHDTSKCVQGESFNPKEEFSKLKMYGYNALTKEINDLPLRDQALYLLAMLQNDILVRPMGLGDASHFLHHVLQKPGKVIDELESFDELHPDRIRALRNDLKKNRCLKKTNESLDFGSFLESKKKKYLK